MNNNVILQNFKQNDDINNNICNRFFPSSSLNMNFSPRPVNTKYTFLPILDNRKPSNVEINNYPIFDISNTFYPGTRNPNFCGFANNVDEESSLRNQFFALQKADQAQWLPNTNSDLYENPVNFVTSNKNLDNHLLFNEERFSDFNPNLSNTIGNEVFYNSTRVQLKNL